MDMNDRDMNVGLFFNGFSVQWNVEGLAWTPDVAQDMQVRVMEMFAEGLALLDAYNLIDVLGSSEPQIVDVLPGADGEDDVDG
jgi:hypothetical protein